MRCCCRALTGWLRWPCQHAQHILICLSGCTPALLHFSHVPKQCLTFPCWPGDSRRTFDPEAADFFYVPTYTSCFAFPVYGFTDTPWWGAPMGGWHAGRQTAAC